jgi:4-hydroxybenzoate polyprenyltransferase
MKKYHPIIIAIWIGLSLCLIVFSYKLGLGKLRSPGPGLMPFSIGGLLLLISLCLLMVDLFKKSAEDKPSEEQRKVNFKKVGMVAASLILYGLLLERLGFPVTTLWLLR